MKPVTPHLPVFACICATCGRQTDSSSAATGEKAWTYVCFFCQDEVTREAVRVSFNRAFERATERDQHRTRLFLLGTSETRRVYARIGKRVPS